LKVREGQKVVIKMAMSDRIEAFITELLKEEMSDGIELGRNELASIFNCVPSQINYVISTRFNPEKGYIVESRRGGGGYIRIKRIPKDIFGDIEEIIRNIGGEISKEKAKGIIEYLANTERLDRKQRIMLEAVVLDALADDEDEVRARVMKKVIEILC